MWISMKDRMPEPQGNKQVITYTPPEVKPLYSGDEGGFRLVTAQFVRHQTDATYWMYIPEPPESENA